MYVCVSERVCTCKLTCSLRVIYFTIHHVDKMHIIYALNAGKGSQFACVHVQSYILGHKLH